MTRATKRLRRSSAMGMAALLSVSGAALATASTASAVTTATSVRVANGADRYATAALAAEAAFPTGATTAILASGDAGHYADALAGNYLAGALSAPILLTTLASTPPETTAALTKLGAKTIDVIGGTSAVSAAQVAALTAAGYTINSISGATRYATDEAVASATGTTVGTFNGLKTAIVTNGGNFPDALASGSLSYSQHFPVIIVAPGSTLNAEATASLTALGIQQVIIVGGDSAISAAQETAIQALTVGGVAGATALTTLRPAAGADRTATSQMLGDWAITNNLLGSTKFSVANGSNAGDGVDALAAGPYAGINDQPILVTADPNTPGAVATFASEHSSTETTVNVFGGTSAVSAAAATSILTAAQTGTAVTAYTVTPTTATTVTESSTGSNTGYVQYTATGLGSTLVDIYLVDAGDITGSGSSVTFLKPSTVSTTATLNQGAGTIAVVNGTGATTINSGTAAVGIKPVNGTVTFSVNSTTPGSAVPVIFSDTVGNDALLVNAAGTPTVSFGIGGEVTWTAVAAPTGAFSGAPGTVTAPGPITVTSVDTANNTFQGTYGSTNATAGTFTYNVAGSTYNYLSSSGSLLSAAQFGADLGADDIVTANYNASGPSTFILTNDVPSAPTAVSAAYNASLNGGLGAVKVSFTASPSADVTTYNILRYPVATDGTIGTTPVTFVQSLSAFNAQGYYLDTAAAAGSYVYAVQAAASGATPHVNDDGTSAQTATIVVPVGTVPGAVAGAPTVVSAGSPSSTFANGHQIQVLFNEPVTIPGPGNVLRLSDGTNSGQFAVVTGAAAANQVSVTQNSDSILVGSTTYLPGQILTFTEGGAIFPISSSAPVLPATIELISGVLDQDQGNAVDLTKGNTLVTTGWTIVS